MLDQHEVVLILNLKCPRWVHQVSLRCSACFALHLYCATHPIAHIVRNADSRRNGVDCGVPLIFRCLICYLFVIWPVYSFFLAVLEHLWGVPPRRSRPTAFTQTIFLIWRHRCLAIEMPNAITSPNRCRCLRFNHIHVNSSPQSAKSGAIRNTSIGWSRGSGMVYDDQFASTSAFNSH